MNNQNNFVAVISPVTRNDMNLTRAIFNNTITFLHVHNIHLSPVSQREISELAVRTN